MPRILIVLTLVSFIAVPVAAQAPPTPRGPSPEMQQLAKQIVGTYKIVERHHARGTRAEWVAEGTASYAAGPDGMSVLEQYKSTGPQGPFSAIAVIWWDDKAAGFKHLECETGEACGVVDDVGKWEGSAVVFRRNVEYQGRKVQAEDRYDFAQPGSIVITSRFAIDGGPQTTAMTITYTRIPATSN